MGIEIKKCEDGSVYYLKDGLLHRPSSEGPAFLHADGSTSYWENGQCHRPMAEGPAVHRMKTGIVEYWVNGSLVMKQNLMTSRFERAEVV